MPIWQLCANLLIPNCLRSNLSYSPLAALELYVKTGNTVKYVNVSSPVGYTYQIFIPATVNYGWGTTSSTLTITVNPNN